jgi:DHA2 family lincomycin resistance protein-like MFS transporter
MLVIGVRRIVNVGELLDVPLDVISIPLTVVGFGGLVFGLSRVGDGAAAAWEPGVAVAVGLAGVLALVLRQLVLQRSDKALLDLRTFTYPTFSIAIAMMAIAMMALFGTIIMLPLILQRSLDLDPLTIGLMLFPGGVVMGVLGPLVGRLYDRFGPRALVAPASFVVAGVFLALSTVTVSTSVWAIVGYHMAMSASFAFIFTPLFTVSLGSVAPKLYSHASAIVGTVQQVAGAAGTALFVTVLAVQSAGAEAAGLPADAALLVGSHWAFLGATAIWTVAMVASFFLRKPAEPQHTLGPAH